MTELSVVHRLLDPEIEADKATIKEFLELALTKDFVAISLVGIDAEGDMSAVRHLSTTGEAFKILGGLSHEQYIINCIIESAPYEDF